jgi:two-component system, chemotaxis family, sensor kinase CheA
LVAGRSPIIHEFLVESFENLSNISDDLTRYEKEPEDKELLNSIYRKIHTLKGSASFLGFNKLQELTHVVESILDLVRENEKTVNSNLIDIFLESFDVCQLILKNVEETEGEGEIEIKPLLDKLEKEINGSETESGISEEAGPSLVPESSDGLESLISLGLAGGAPVPSDVVSNSVEKIEEELKVLPQETKVELSIPTKVTPPLSVEIEQAEAVIKEEKVTEKPQAKEAPVKVAKNKSKPPETVAQSKGPIADSFVRVNVKLLDKIIR